MRKYAGLAFVAGLLILVIAIHLTWTRNDPRYPTDDAGSYAAVSQEVYFVGLKHGFFAAVNFAYLHRHWKPLLGQNLLAPFLALTSGDVRLAFKVYAVLMSLALVLGMFLAFKEWTGDRWLSFLIVLRLTLMPWMLADLVSFGSEAPWIMFSAWALFFFSRSGGLDDRRDSILATLFFALAAMCRPVESLLLFLPPFAWTLLARTEGRRRVAHAAAFLIELLAVSVLMAGPFFLQWGDADSGEYGFLTRVWIVAGFLTYTGGKLWVWWRADRSEGWKTQMLWSLGFGLVLAWYLPGFGALVSWVKQTTSGPMVAESANFALNRFGYWPLMLERAGAFLLVPLLLGLIFVGRRRRQVPQRGLGFLIWAAASLPILGSFTMSRDFRYYHLSWVMLALLGATVLSRVLVLRADSRFRAGAIAVMGFMIVAIGLGRLPGALGLQLPFKSSGVERFFAGQSGVYRTREPDVEFEALSDYLLSLPMAPDATVLMVDQHNARGAEPLSAPFRHTLRAREKGRFWDFQFLENLRDRETSDVDLLRHAFRLGEVMVVGAPNENVPAGHWTEQQNRIARLLFGCVDSTCEAYGLTLAGRFEVPAAEGQSASRFLVFSLPRVGVPKCARFFN